MTSARQMDEEDAGASEAGIPAAAYGALDRDPFAGAPTFTGANRLKRVVWNATWILLAAWTPPPLRRWRTLLLRLFGARVDWSVNVYGSARVWHPSKLTMGRQATLGPNVRCYNMATVTVGDRAVVSQGAYLCTGTHRVDDPSFQLVAKPIYIGANAWVAADAFVGPGVEVGDGAVLGARGVSTKNLDPWTIYAGNPAVALRKRRQERNND